MKKIILVLLVLVSGLTLGGCGIKNEDLISERDKCINAGMDYNLVGNTDLIIFKVNCVPKED